MHTPHVTPLYAALLAILFLVLARNVILRRRAGRIPIGTAGDATLERAARVHGNFAEYVPLALLLLLLAELAAWPAAILHLAGAALVAGRLSHAWGVSRAPEDFRFRVAGMITTLTVIGVLAALALAAAFWPG